MSATSRAVMLAALSLGVLLVGIELFITAVALPKIFLDLSSWAELRRASWIVNAYLVSYIAVMPLAGRAADRFGLPRLVMLALAVFSIGSLVCGAAQSLDQLLVGRTIQGAGAGALLPLATAGASHLYVGAARSRALGIVGSATFLGMAIGPVLGVLVLGQLGLRDALAGVGIWSGPLVDLLTPAWRWVFYVTAPLALLAIAYVWAAAPGWDVGPGQSHMDALGAVLASTALASGLLAITLVGDDPGQLPVIGVAGAVALVTGILAGIRMLRTPEPFLDLRLFADRIFSSAVLISLLTGYALATVIVGIATYVDRVRFGPLDEQLVVLGSLALAMSVGAFASGFSLRLLSATAVTVLGLASSVAGLVLLSGFRPESDMGIVVAGLVAFGLGFGLTVTPRSVAAVEAAGRKAYGMASAAVTVARMAGMALGMAILTAFGTTRIDSVTEAFNDPAFRDQILPPDLAGRTMADPIVLDALERWAAGEAASVLGSLFLVAAAVLVAAVLPALMMRGAGSHQGRQPDGAPTGAGDRDETVEGAIAGF